MAHDITASGSKAHALPWDVGDPEALAAIHDSARRTLGSEPAGGRQGRRTCAERGIPWMEASGRGSILFLPSVSGLEVKIPLNFGYRAAQAAPIAHTNTLAVMQAPQGSRGNAIAPGFIVAPSSVWSMVKRDKPEIGESVPASIPWGCLRTLDEVAGVEIVLASPRAAWVAGEIVSVDGAQHRGMR